MWVQVEMDDALELLGPTDDFKDERVREFAVGVLGRADDEVSLIYFKLIRRLTLLDRN